MSPPILPNFHDVHFDGVQLAANKEVHLFFRTTDQREFVLVLEGVEKLILDCMREGNVILDLVLRGTDSVTRSDIETLYGVTSDSLEAEKLWRKVRESKLQILEINPSYGADGTILFLSWHINPKTPQP